MTPTVKLRFVWRDGVIENNGGVFSKKAVRVLQQWWQAELTGEWRDVPLEPAAVPAPPKKEWVGLTDEEYQAIRYGYNENGERNVEYELFDEGEYGTEVNIYVDDFARAIEAKLKEKNT